MRYIVRVRQGLQPWDLSFGWYFFLYFLSLTELTYKILHCLLCWQPGGHILSDTLKYFGLPLTTRLPCSDNLAGWWFDNLPEQEESRRKPHISWSIDLSLSHSQGKTSPTFTSWHTLGHSPDTGGGSPASTSSPWDGRLAPKILQKVISNSWYYLPAEGIRLLHPILVYRHINASKLPACWLCRQLEDWGRLKKTRR